MLRNHDGTDELARRTPNEPADRQEIKPLRLTRRQVEILELAGTGLRSKEIARRLNLSVRTVDNHLQQLLVRNGAHSRSQALIMWYRQQQGGF